MQNVTHCTVPFTRSKSRGTAAKGSYISQSKMVRDQLGTTEAESGRKREAEPENAGV